MLLEACSRMSASAGEANAHAAAALADLFFLRPSVSDAEKLRANELRRKYRDWRVSSSTAQAHADVLDLNHEAITSEKRSTATLRRVKTVGARMQDISPVRSDPGRP